MRRAPCTSSSTRCSGCVATERWSRGGVPRPPRARATSDGPRRSTRFAIGPQSLSHTFRMAIRAAEARTNLAYSGGMCASACVGANYNIHEKFEWWRVCECVVAARLRPAERNPETAVRGAYRALRAPARRGRTAGVPTRRRTLPRSRRDDDRRRRGARSAVRRLRGWVTWPRPGPRGRPTASSECGSSTVVATGTVPCPRWVLREHRTADIHYA